MPTSRTTVPEKSPCSFRRLCPYKPPEQFTARLLLDQFRQEDKYPARNFPKRRIASFARIPESNPNLMQPTLHPSPYQPAPFFTTTSQRHFLIHFRKVCRV
jgi:hypothetical protein